MMPAMIARTTVAGAAAMITARNMTNLANQPASGGMPARLKKKIRTIRTRRRVASVCAWGVSRVGSINITSALELETCLCRYSIGFKKVAVLEVAAVVVAAAAAVAAAVVAVAVVAVVVAAAAVVAVAVRDCLRLQRSARG